MTAPHPVLSRRAIVVLAIVMLGAPFATVAQPFFAFVVGVFLTRAVQGWLASQLLPRTRLDDGLRNSIKTIFGYVGIFLALDLGGSTRLELSEIGVDRRRALRRHRLWPAVGRQ